MKRITTVLLACTISTVMQAQVMIAILFGDKLNSGKLEFGLVVAPGLTGISNIESKRKAGLDLGIYFNIRPDKKFFIHAEGIGKASLGAKKIIPYPTGSDTLDRLFAGGSVERKIKAFSLPVLCRYAISRKFFAEAGVQADMMIGTKDIFHTKINDNALDYTVKVPEVSFLDVGIAAGFHFKFRKDKSMGIGIRYFQGLTDMLKSTSGTQLNTAWKLNIAVPIGTGKANTARSNP